MSEAGKGNHPGWDRASVRPLFWNEQEVYLIPAHQSRPTFVGSLPLGCPHGNAGSEFSPPLQRDISTHPSYPVGAMFQQQLHHRINLIPSTTRKISLTGRAARARRIPICIERPEGLSVPTNDRANIRETIKYKPSKLPKSASFPVKLHEMLSNPLYSDLITWSDNGTSWRVLQAQYFEEIVLPQYFRSQRYTSFMRQASAVDSRGLPKVYNLSPVSNTNHVCLS